MDKTIGAVNILDLTAQAGLSNLPNIVSKVQSESTVSFQETFMKTSEVKQIENDSKEVSPTKTIVEGSAVNNNKIKTADAKDNEQSLDEDKMKEIDEVVTKATDEVKEKIKSEFGVTDEQIEEAMEVLGILPQDLFDQADLRSLVMELTETPDSIELLTNVELYDSLKEVTDFTEGLLKDVSEELNIPEEQLTEIINSDSFKQTIAQLGKTEEAATLVNTEAGIENNTISEGTEKEVTEISRGNEKAEVSSKNSDEKTVVENVITAENAKDTKATNKEEKPFVVEVEVEKTEGTRTSNPVVANDLSKENNSSSQNNGERKQNLFDNSRSQDVNITQPQTVTTQTVNTLGEVVETVTSYSSYADTENILRQVTDYVRVNVSEDVTKMEMQLHPASLGTVNMQINSQNGQITAHLTVQNELVKSILESQMIKLQETFNEQGTKVTAIEVSVADYNLDASSDNNYSQERRNNQSGSSRRGINLNEINSFDELTDEEQLEAEVMEMNGSSVNYKA